MSWRYKFESYEDKDELEMNGNKNAQRGLVGGQRAHDPALTKPDTERPGGRGGV